MLQILLTFVFLVIGFSLSFMIQFRAQIPFDGPWAALVKTIVMMTSEFDYEALFDKEHSEQLATSLIIVRIIFLVFLILAAIVLMNLLVGVAVNDINDLEVLGNIRRLVKQVEFLGTLDTLVYNRVFSCILPKRVNQSLKNKRKVHAIMVLCPGRPRWRYSKLLPARLKDVIFTKAQEQMKQIEDEQGLQSFKKQLNEMHEALMNLNKQKTQELPDIIKTNEEEFPIPKSRTKYDEVVSHLKDLDEYIGDVKVETKAYATESKSSIDALSSKVDRLAVELQAIKMFLTRLESKLV